MTDGFTLEESARRLGHFRWLEVQLFALLGGWQQDVPELDAKLLIAGAARHHAWRAGMLGERLPHVRDLSPERLTVPPSAGWPGLLATIDGFGSTAERLAAVYRVVVPHAVAAHTAHLDRCNPVADEPVMRALRLILVDESWDLAAAEPVVGALLVDNGAEVAAAAAVERIVELAATEGGIAGA